MAELTDVKKSFTDDVTSSAPGSKFEFQVLEPASPASAPESQYLETRELVLVFIGFLVSVLLVTIDQTIVSTALPRIISHFNALQDVSWIAAAYFVTQGGFILIYGQILTIAVKKHVFLCSIALFELGSLLCAVSNSMALLIAGRAIAGAGGSGIQMAVATMIPEVAALEIRPILFASFGAVIGLSAVAGPLLGGVLTDKVSWRWCFYINLPLGAGAVLLVILLLRPRPVPNASGSSTLRRLMGLDWIGAILTLGIVTSLLLALQWGGNTKPWNSPVIIALFVVSGILCAFFVYWEYRLGPEKAMVPLKIFSSPTSVGCVIATFFVNMAFLFPAYYLPLWYQAKGRSATHSGLDILPFLISVVVGAGVTGAIVTKTGRYWWFLFLSPLLISVGGGILYTLTDTTSTPRLIGYQIIYGAGIGCCLQNFMIAIQAEYATDEKMIPQATSVASFSQVLGNVVGIAIAGSVFANQLKLNLARLVPNLSPEDLQQILQSVTIVSTLPDEIRTPVLVSYVRALDPVFLIGVPAGALTCLASWWIADYNLKQRSAGTSMGPGMA